MKRGGASPPPPPGCGAHQVSSNPSITPPRCPFSVSRRPRLRSSADSPACREADAPPCLAADGPPSRAADSPPSRASASRSWGRSRDATVHTRRRISLGFVKWKRRRCPHPTGSGDHHHPIPALPPATRPARRSVCSAPCLRRPRRPHLHPPREQQQHSGGGDIGGGEAGATKTATPVRQSRGPRSGAGRRGPTVSATATGDDLHADHAPLTVIHWPTGSRPF